MAKTTRPRDYIMLEIFSHRQYCKSCRVLIRKHTVGESSNYICNCSSLNEEAFLNGYYHLFPPDWTMVRVKIEEEIY